MATNEITTFAEEVTEQFAKTITDHVFLMIENDRELFQRYLRLVSDHKLDPTNQIIGKKVKERFQLTNSDRNTTPMSKLIKSFQGF